MRSARYYGSLRFVPRWSLLALAAIILLSLKELGLAQGIAASGSLALTVRNARYAPVLDTIQIVLSNDGNRPVLAYKLAITIRQGSTPLQQFGFGEDLTEVVLNSRETSHSDDVWDGAIKPGTTYEVSIPASLGSQNPAMLSIEAVVSGVLWSDQTISTLDQPTLDQVHRWQQYHEDSASTEQKLISIIALHKADPNVPRHIALILHDTDLLKQQRDKRDTSGTGRPGTDRSLVEMYENNLEGIGAEIQSSALPADALEAYNAMFVSRHNRRLKLLHPSAQSTSN